VILPTEWRNFIVARKTRNNRKVIILFFVTHACFALVND
jgi:hypothetical protein